MEDAIQRTFRRRPDARSTTHKSGFAYAGRMEIFVRDVQPPRKRRLDSSQGWRSAAGRDENPWYRQKGGPRPGRGAGNMQISAPFQGSVTYNAGQTMMLSGARCGRVRFVSGRGFSPPLTTPPKSTGFSPCGALLPTPADLATTEQGLKPKSWVGGISMAG